MYNWILELLLQFQEKCSQPPNGDGSASPDKRGYSSAPSPLVPPMNIFQRFEKESADFNQSLRKFCVFCDNHLLGALPIYHIIECVIKGTITCLLAPVLLCRRVISHGCISLQLLTFAGTYLQGGTRQPANLLAKSSITPYTSKENF